jgi:hypothetical protein
MNVLIVKMEQTDPLRVVYANAMLVIGRILIKYVNYVQIQFLAVLHAKMQVCAKNVIPTTIGYSTEQTSVFVQINTIKVEKIVWTVQKNVKLVRTILLVKAVFPMILILKTFVNHALIKWLITIHRQIIASHVTLLCIFV